MTSFSDERMTLSTSKFLRIEIEIEIEIEMETCQSMTINSES